MAEEWRLAEGTVGGLALGTVVVFIPFGDEVRVADPKGNELVRLRADQLIQAFADGGLTMRVTSGPYGAEATFTRTNARPGDPPPTLFGVPGESTFPADVTEGILKRDLHAQLPEAVRSQLVPGERALVIVPGLRHGAAVATQERVILWRPTGNPRVVVYAYGDLTGASVGEVGALTYLRLDGPGLPTQATGLLGALGALPPNMLACRGLGLAPQTQPVTELAAIIAALHKTAAVSATTTAGQVIPAPSAPTGPAPAAVPFTASAPNDGLTPRGRLRVNHSAVRHGPAAEPIVIRYVCTPQDRGAWSAGGLLKMAAASVTLVLVGVLVLLVTSSWLVGVVLVGAGAGYVAFRLLGWPMIARRYFGDHPDGQQVTITLDDSAATYTCGTFHRRLPWDVVRRTNYSGRYVLIVGRTPAFVWPPTIAIPIRAIPPPLDRDALLAVANEHVSAAGSLVGDEALTELENRERVLKTETFGWTSPIKHHYDVNADGFDDFEDDRTILEVHGYRADEDTGSVERTVDWSPAPSAGGASAASEPPPAVHAAIPTPLVFEAVTPHRTTFGQVITWGSVPWAAVVLLRTDPNGAPAPDWWWQFWVWLAIASVPIFMWAVLSWVGPRRGLRWWFGPRARVLFDATGMTIDEDLGAVNRAVEWPTIHGVDVNYGAFQPLSLMGAGWQRLRGIPNDLQWVQPPGQHGVYSFAMALVSAQPRVYSLWGASPDGIPQGAHLADPDDDVTPPVPLPDREAAIRRRAAVVAVAYFLGTIVMRTIGSIVFGAR